MIALLLAAAVSGQAASRQTEPMPNAFKVPARCGSIIEQEVHRQAVALHGKPPLAQYAVYRRLDGCPVPAPIGYHPNYAAPDAATPEGAPSDRR